MIPLLPTSIYDLLAWGDSSGKEEPMRLECNAKLLHPASKGCLVRGRTLVAVHLWRGSHQECGKRDDYDEYLI